jgi:hypothetical protein
MLVRSVWHISQRHAFTSSLGDCAGAKDRPSRTAREASMPAIADENAWRESYHGA